MPAIDLGAALLMMQRGMGLQMLFTLSSLGDSLFVGSSVKVELTVAINRS